MSMQARLFQSVLATGRVYPELASELAVAWAWWTDGHPTKPGQLKRPLLVFSFSHCLWFFIYTEHQGAKGARFDRWPIMRSLIWKARPQGSQLNYRHALVAVKRSHGWNCASQCLSHGGFATPMFLVACRSAPASSDGFLATRTATGKTIASAACGGRGG